jgi:hypothetical protein
MFSHVMVGSNDIARSKPVAIIGATRRRGPMDGRKILPPQVGRFLQHSGDGRRSVEIIRYVIFDPSIKTKLVTGEYEALHFANRS